MLQRNASDWYVHVPDTLHVCAGNHLQAYQLFTVNE